MTQGAEIRLIQQADDPGLACIIRDTLIEFGVNRPGTAFEDKVVDHLSGFYSIPGTIYYVVCQAGKIIGGAGIYSLEGVNGYCELQKMYLLPTARGKGLGFILLARCLEFARESGYTTCYLETMPEFKSAIRLYESLGFRKHSRSLGNTGHFGCGVWMTLKL